MASLIVIAGPNGSGKSSYTNTLETSLIREYGILSFDYDLEFAKLYNRFLSIMTQTIEINLEAKTKEIFKESAYNCLNDSKNFSFQTNFNKSYTDKWRRQFGDKGFDTNLYFLYVDTLSKCRKRVEKRVLEGGHNVPKSEIKSRYFEG